MLPLTDNASPYIFEGQDNRFRFFSYPPSSFDSYSPQFEEKAAEQANPWDSNQPKHLKSKNISDVFLHLTSQIISDHHTNFIYDQNTTELIIETESSDINFTSIIKEYRSADEWHRHCLSDISARENFFEWLSSVDIPDKYKPMISADRLVTLFSYLSLAKQDRQDFIPFDMGLIRRLKSSGVLDAKTLEFIGEDTAACLNMMTTDLYRVVNPLISGKHQRLGTVYEEFPDHAQEIFKLSIVVATYARLGIQTLHRLNASSTHQEGIPSLYYRGKSKSTEADVPNIDLGFASYSDNYESARTYARTTADEFNATPVVLTTNSRNAYAARRPYANISLFSKYPGEAEVLFVPDNDEARELKLIGLDNDRVEHYAPQC